MALLLHPQTGKIICMEEQVKPTDAMNETVNTTETEETNTAIGTEEVKEETTEVEKLTLELAEQKDKYLRLLADFDNFKRRSAKERIEYLQTAGKEVIVGLLDVLDDSERAEQQWTSSSDVEQIKQGVSLVFNKLRTTLTAKGLKEMNAKGTDFNADLHEAITEIPAPTPELVDKVVDEVTKGYYLNDKIIRFAKVVVGK